MSSDNTPVTEFLRELQELIEGSENIMQGSHPTKYEEGFIAAITIVRSKTQGFAKQIENYIENEIETRIDSAVESRIEASRESRYED